MKFIKYLLIAGIAFCVLAFCGQIITWKAQENNYNQEYQALNKESGVLLITNEVDVQLASEQTTYSSVINFPGANYQTLYKGLASDLSTKNYCYYNQGKFTIEQFNACLALPTMTISEVVSKYNYIILDLDIATLLQNDVQSYQQAISKVNTITSILREYNPNVKIYVLAEKPQNKSDQLYLKINFYYKQSDQVKLVYDEN